MVKEVGRYLLYQTLGEGNFSKVKYAVHKDTKLSVAIKILEKEKLVNSNMTSHIKSEISILKMIKHENLIEIKDVFASQSKIFIVLEYIEGGELLDLVIGEKTLTERRACSYFNQLVSGMLYCHEKGICHRDLKPENILVTSTGVLKISDFGLSTIVDIKHNHLLDNAVGTPNYIAPEVVRRQQYDGKAADCWSIGVILYVLMAGYFPFEADPLLDLFTLIRESKVVYPYWFNTDLVDLLKKIFVYDPSKRYTITDIRSHEWFRKYPVVLVGVVRNSETNRLEEVISSRSTSRSTSRTVSRSNSLEPGLDRYSIVSNSAFTNSIIGSNTGDKSKFSDILKEATDEIITEENTSRNARASPLRTTIVISRPKSSHNYDEEGIVLIEKDETELNERFLGGIFPCCSW